MSKFEGTDFDNVDQSFDIGSIKGDYDAWKSKWNKGKNWGIVGGKDGNKPKTLLETVLSHGDATYARDQARSIEGLGTLLEALTEVFDGDTVEVEHRMKLELAIEGMSETLKRDKGQWNPRNIPFETVIEFNETDDPQEPDVVRGTVYGHYRTKAYNEYAEWANKNKPNSNIKIATANDDWSDKEKNKSRPPLWQAITGVGETDEGKGGILFIARKALKGVDKIKMGDGNRIAIFNNSTGPKQLAQIKSVQEKVIEVLQNPSIYPSGKSRAPMKDRLNAAFTNESYAIRNKEEAKLLNFAKGYDRVEGIEKLKTVKLRFPKNNLALNRTIVEVLRILGEEIQSYQTPKAKEGTAKPGLILKQKVEKMDSWQDILKNEELEKGKVVDFVENFLANRQIGFQDKQTKKSFIDTNKRYMSGDGITQAKKTFYYFLVKQEFDKNKRLITLQDLQQIENAIEESRRKAKLNRQREQANYNYNARRA